MSKLYNIFVEKACSIYMLESAFYFPQDGWLESSPFAGKQFSSRVKFGFVGNCQEALGYYTAKLTGQMEGEWLLTKKLINRSEMVRCYLFIVILKLHSLLHATWGRSMGEAANRS